MKLKNYLQESERTERKFPNGLELDSDAQYFLDNLGQDLAAICSGIDHMKRVLIYDKECEMVAPQTEFARRVKNLTPEQAEFLHAAMGMVTEAEEFFSQLMAHILRDQDLDKTNLFEEVGDSMWYQALALRLMFQTFENAAQTNIDKLRDRFPNKFESDKALNRDLDAERKTLEQGESR